MSTGFPSSIDAYARPGSTEPMNSPDHTTVHDNTYDAIEAIEAKVGAAESAVTTSHDYKLSSVTSTAKAVSTAGNQTVTGDKTFSGTSVFSGKTTVAQAVQTVTTASDGATVTFNLSLGNIHKVTLGGNRTLAISNETAGQCFVVELIQDGTGSRTVTWFSTISWAGGTTPTLTTTASKTDVFGFICTGTDTYLGFIVGLNC